MLRKLGNTKQTLLFLCAFVIVLWLGVSVCLLIVLEGKNTRSFIDMEGKIAVETWQKDYDQNIRKTLI